MYDLKMEECTIKVRCVGTRFGCQNVVARLGVEVNPTLTCSLGEYTLLLVIMFFLPLETFVVLIIFEL